MANLIQCPTCGKEISCNAASCPFCGEPIRKHKCRSVKGGIISFFTGLLLCIIIGVLSKTGVLPRENNDITFLAFLFLILGIVGSCICFTSPTK